MKPNTFEEIIDEIKKHDEKNPEHGIACACHDGHAGHLRRIVMEKQLSDKSRRNLSAILHYFLQGL